MRTVGLAYRDNDRMPVIAIIQEMARRHYDIDVRVIQIVPTKEYEDALFVDQADLIVEHLEYYFGQRTGERPVTMFAAPIVEAELALVVRPEVQSAEDLVGGTFAVRTHGRFHTVLMRIRAMGLEGRVQHVMTPDDDVGRWGQWRRVVSGECVAAFVSPLYLPAALEAGLKVLPTQPLPQVELYAHLCLTSFAQANDQLMTDYMKALVHAGALMRCQREASLAIANGEARRLITEERGLPPSDEAEWQRWFDHIIKRVQIKPYPTLQAIANSYEAAVAEYPEVAGRNPLAPWDLHWLKALDDSGWIGQLVASLS